LVIERELKVDRWHRSNEDSIHGSLMGLRRLVFQLRREPDSPIISNCGPLRSLGWWGSVLKLLFRFSIPIFCEVYGDFLPQGWKFPDTSPGK